MCIASALPFQKGGGGAGYISIVVLYCDMSLQKNMLYPPILQLLSIKQKMRYIMYFLPSTEYA